VMAEIERAVEQYDAGFIDFEDENLSLDRRWFLDLLGAIQNRFGKKDLELRAMNGLFPPALDEEIICAMAGSGFRTLNLSLGSTSADQLKKFQRPDVRQAFDAALELAPKYGLQAVGYIIVGGPDQRAEDSVRDLLYLAERRVLAGVSVFYPAPGCPDYERCRSLDLLPNSYALMRASALPISHTTTRKESSTLLRLGRVLNFIKSTLDRGASIPQARLHSQQQPIDISDRVGAGRQLLGWFLHDGKIRGVRPDGAVYEHNISTRLSRMFLDGLKNIEIKGTL
jgi:anaerobic magnesium-protoporphyrin IX monomethyl ester cyclase